MRRFLLVFAAIVALGMVSVLLLSDGLAADKNPVVVVETSMGTIKIELFEDKAPGTVKNFLQYVDDKHYDGTIFHRVIPNFMIQAGGFESGMKERKARAPIKGEANNGVKNERGTLAMGLKPGDPNSGTSHIYINLKHNAHLDNMHTVFGKVTEGMDVVEKMSKVETGRVGPHGDVPTKDLVIKSIKREEKK
jgi:peptidyl-prolyl cis-trans isomerase B (cyclophilin B)